MLSQLKAVTRLREPRYPLNTHERIIMRSSKARSITGFLLLISGFPILTGNATVQAQSVTYSDGTFNPADWEVLQSYTAGNGGSVVVSQPASGGNPAQFRLIGHTINSPPSGQFSSAAWLHRRLGATFSPQTQGSIQLIDYSEDFIVTQPGGGGAVGAGVALRQNGRVFQVYFESSSTQWFHKELLALTALDFFAVDGTNDHPDFSAFGAPIDFGFARSNSTCVDCPGYFIETGIDNWSLTVHHDQPIPTVSEWGLIVMSLLILTAGTVVFTSRRTVRAAGP